MERSKRKTGMVLNYRFKNFNKWSYVLKKTFPKILNLNNNNTNKFKFICLTGHTTNINWLCVGYGTQSTYYDNHHFYFINDYKILDFTKCKKETSVCDLKNLIKRIKNYSYGEST